MAMTDVLKKMNRIFDGLLGCSLEFQASDRILSDEWKGEDLALLKGPPEAMPHFFESLNGASVGFPINLNGSFFGLAVVQGSLDRQPRKLFLLAELLTMMADYSSRLDNRRERLRLIEERLQRQILEEGTNIIPLRPSRLGRPLQLIETEHTPVESPAAPISTLPLLIETRSGFPLQRIAVEIHQLSGRWAFLSLSDLPGDALDSRQSLEQLGNVTLFIRDLSELNPRQQQKLIEYLATQPSGDMPHVIAGTNKSVYELEASGTVRTELLELFCISSLLWTEKSSQQITNDLINASLQHILDQTRNLVQVEAQILPLHSQYLDPDNSTLH